MKAKPIRLYDYRFSGNGYKIRLALSQLNINVEVKDHDLLQGETRSREFLAKNPMGQIPVLELDDGTFLRESNAILFWLTNGTHLMPTDVAAQTLVLQWMFFEQSNIDKVLGRTRFLKAFPNFRNTVEQEWSEWYQVGNKALSVLEEHLRDKEFLLGSFYSAADICLYGYVHTAEEGGFALAVYPAVKAWIERVKATNGYIPQNQ